LKVSTDEMISKPAPPWLAQEYERCRFDIPRFNRAILNRPPFWSRQADLCDSFVKYQTTICMAGNSVGKSFAVPAPVLHYSAYNPGSKIVITSSSETQLRQVTWANVLKAFYECPYRLFPKARVYKQPMKIEITEDWWILAYTTTKKERMTGHHSGRLAVVVDEASGVERDIFEALDSLAPHRTLLIGNPLRPEGVFYERVLRQRANPSDKVNLIKIPSTESPDITVEHSARGMASKSWLDAMRRQWGEGSLWWKPHVLAEFPDADTESLIPIDWLFACEQVYYTPGGQKRIAIDLSTGSGADRTVILVRDDNGIIDFWESKVASLEETAWKAFEFKRKHDISDHLITYDAAGIGADFAFRLRSVGIHNAIPYIGGKSANSNFRNHRTWSYWSLRCRLDPNGSWKRPFHIPAGIMSDFKREVSAVKYRLSVNDVTELIPKEDVIDILGHSPDIADALSQSFCYTA